MLNRSVLITGCSSGFGLELVRSFLVRGWTVIASMRDAANRSDILAPELRTYPDRLHLLSLDVTSPAERNRALAEVTTKCGGKLDVLVNNAGMGLFGPLEDVTEEQLRAQMDVNFFGLAFLTKEALPLLRAAKGKVINLSSILGLIGAPLTSSYCASKFAVEGLSECLAYELRPFGVSVVLVEPGAHRTNFSPNVVWTSTVESSPYYARVKRYRNELRGMLEKRGTPMDGVIEKIISIAEGNTWRLRFLCGIDAKLIYAAKRLLPEFIYRPLTAIACRMLYYRE